MQNSRLFDNKILEHFLEGDRAGLKNSDIFLVGNSGSGREFVVQEITSSFVKAGGKAFIIDDGKIISSFKEFDINNIEFDLKAPISVNPFTNIPTGDDEQSVLIRSTIFHLLVIVFNSMVRSTIYEESGCDALLSNDVQQIWLPLALSECWKAKGRECEVTDIANYLIAHEDNQAREVGKFLFEYSKEGKYGGFFTGISSVEFKSEITAVTKNCDSIQTAEENEMYPIFLQLLTILHLLESVSDENPDERLVIFFESYAGLIYQRSQFLCGLINNRNRFNNSPNYLIDDFGFGMPSYQDRYEEKLKLGCGIKIIMDMGCTHLTGVNWFPENMTPEATISCIKNLESRYGNWSDFSIFTERDLIGTFRLKAGDDLSVQDVEKLEQKIPSQEAQDDFYPPIEEDRWSKYKSMTFFEVFSPLVFLALLYLAWHIPVSRINQIQEKQDTLYELVKAKVAAAEEYPTSPLEKLRAISNKQSEYYAGDLMVMQGPMRTDLKPVHIPEPDLSHRGLIKK